MNNISARFVGVEIYFDNLERAKNFYVETLGLRVSDQQPGHHVKFDSDAGFVCLERKGSESYASSDKAALFFEVPDLNTAISAIGQDRFAPPKPSGLCYTIPKAIRPAPSGELYLTG
jgi:predicted enzyme related to lactoylglutathione lyase